MDPTAVETGYRVTAIVSTYQAERFIAGRLENLLQQGMHQDGALEIIVVDSASPQREDRIVRRFQADSAHLHYLRTARRETVYAAWNRAVRASSGRYLINANSDDRFADDALAALAAALDEDPDIAAVYGDWRVTDTANVPLDPERAQPLWRYPDFDPRLLYHGQISSHAPMIRRSVFGRIGPYREDLAVFGDREWMLRLALAGLRVGHIDRVVGLYYENPQGLYNAETTAGQNEFIALMDRYLAPKQFTRLTGLDPAAGVARLADAYVSVGLMGRCVGTLDGEAVVNLGTAGRLFAQALTLDENHAAALGNLAIVAAINGQPAEAERLFARAAENARGEMARRLAANRESAAGGAGAVADFDWLSPTDRSATAVSPPAPSGPDDPAAAYARIQGEVQAGRLEAAARALAELTARHPDFAPAHNDLGVVCHRLGRRAPVRGHYEAALRLAPDNVVYRKNLADFLYLEEADAEAAMHHYIRVLADAPRDVETLLAVGRICQDLDRRDDAADFYRQVLVVDPVNKEARRRLDEWTAGAPVAAATEDQTAADGYAAVQEMLAQGRCDEALAALERLAARHPDFAPAQNDLGALYYRQGQKTEAAARYAEAVRLAPDNAVYRKNLADLYYVEQGRVEEALQHYVRVLSDDPRDVETLVILGRICEDLQRPGDARDFYRRALEIDPTAAAARQRIDALAPSPSAGGLA